ncbi:DUF5753 domain-containing protein [Actinomadura sp. 7K534]|uniref:DUF5753 domain-containing protein n=1 Tax=Actinomadura sp. 7K534 TaxID=2530366 RepID=UPI001046AB1A|nr:DUF5753 domain-containing protein [Actinomadura sp. 7K534]TDB99304.1 transcriptional regulator [Actinomadura sp. 7K534]
MSAERHLGCADCAGGCDAGGRAGCRCTMAPVWVPQCEPDALTRPRLLLAARLRGLRLRRRISVEAAAASVGSRALLQAMERGVTASSPHHVMTLATLYGVTDHETRSMLLQLALHSGQEGWWEPYRSLIRPGFLPFLGAEQAAQMIRCYAVDAVPDLLQHPDYARAVIVRAHPGAGDEELRRRLDLLLRRQRILYAAEPPHVWVVLDEKVLLRRAVPARAMYRQFDHLLDLCELPHLTVQVMPLDAGTALPPGPIALVRVLQDRDVTRVAYLQQLDTAMYPLEADRARHWLNNLAVQAAHPDQTPARLRQAIRELAEEAAAPAGDAGVPGAASVADDTEASARV